MEQERTYYEEAKRYINNAEEILKKSKKDGKYYTDPKYVISAFGTAYASVERAAKWYIKLKGVKLKSAKFDQVKEALSKIDKKAPYGFNSLYTTLHIDGYDGVNTDSTVIQVNLKSARDFISYLKHFSEKVKY